MGRVLTFLSLNTHPTGSRAFSTLGICFITVFELLTGSSDENYFTLSEANPYAVSNEYAQLTAVLHTRMYADIDV